MRTHKRTYRQTDVMIFNSLFRNFSNMRKQSTGTTTYVNTQLESNKRKFHSNLGLRLYLMILDKACCVPAGHHTYYVRMLLSGYWLEHIRRGRRRALMLLNTISL